MLVLALGLFLVTISWHLSRSRFGKALTVVLALGLLGGATWTLQPAQVNGYLSRLPLQLGGTRPAKVELMVSGVPAHLYPDGTTNQENRRSKRLELVYIGQEAYVVRLPGEAHLYQIPKAQVRTLISMP